jgi:thiol-disulfide isomerase/thioredoxin
MQLVVRARRWIPSMLLGVFALAAYPARVSGQEGGIAVGAQAPAVAPLETLSGGTYSLADVVGKRPVLIEFWATWCPLCKQLEPTLQLARERYGDRVAFIGIGVPNNQTPDRQRQFVEERKMSGTFLFDRTSAAIKAFQVPHTSYVVVLDKSGKVVYTGVGGTQDIEGAIGKAFASQ